MSNFAIVIMIIGIYFAISFMVALGIIISGIAEDRSSIVDDKYIAMVWWGSFFIWPLALLYLILYLNVKIVFFIPIKIINFIFKKKRED